MKNQRSFLVKQLAIFAAVVIAAGPAPAQPRGGMGMVQGPQFSGAMEKLFGDHKSFSATMEFQTEGGASGKSMTMTGSMAFLDGKSRFEMDMLQMQGTSIPPQAVARMKQMGMDKMVAISDPEAKIVRTLYPSMNAYVEMPMPDPAGGTPAADYKVDTKEIGSETVSGHPCTKNQVTVTGADGVPHESTVWNATDLDKFPLKIELNDNGKRVSMTFKDVKLDKPDAALFNPPAGYTKYDNMMSLMMSRARGAAGSP
jgi:outer membrane lipoprotein-sorting protein